MSGEASHFAVVLQRIVRRALDQFRDLSESDLNRPLALPESNSAFVLATHLIGSAEYWVLQLDGRYLDPRKKRFLEPHQRNDPDQLVDEFRTDGRRENTEKGGTKAFKWIEAVNAAHEWENRRKGKEILVPFS